MKKMQCEVCGSTSIKKIDDSTFECQSCGVQYSKTELQKLLVEITGEVRIDRNAEVANMITNMRRLYKNQDYSRVVDTCDKILNIQPDNVDAILYGGYASANQTSVSDIRLGDAFRAVSDAIKIQYEKLGSRKEFFEFAANTMYELNKITDRINSFCHNTIVSANLMYGRDPLSGAIDAKEELNLVKNLSTTIALNFFVRFGSLNITDYSNATNDFFSNYIEMLKWQYSGNAADVSVARMDLNTILCFKVPSDGTAKYYVDNFLKFLKQNAFIARDAECERLMTHIKNPNIDKNKMAQIEKEVDEEMKAFEEECAQKKKKYRLWSLVGLVTTFIPIIITGLLDYGFLVFLIVTTGLVLFVLGAIKGFGTNYRYKIDTKRKELLQNKMDASGEGLDAHNKEKRETGIRDMLNNDLTGYTCPVCKMAMDRNAPCERCGYVPPQSN